VIDPFRYFHNAKENISDEMGPVMQCLRACARFGGAVVIMHHPAKTEGSTGRGSTVIRGACDLAFLHSLDKESSLITIKVDKNRNGESRTITMHADFEEGRFEVTEAPYITKRNDELGKLAAIIKATPGLSQNAICKSSGMMKARCIRLLQEGKGKRWKTEKSGHALGYFVISGSGSENHLEPKNWSKGSGSTVLSSLEENREPSPDPDNREGRKPNGKPSLTQCQSCQSFDVYREKDGTYTCMTCEVQWAKHPNVEY
jgi:hypothetical protein